MLVGLVLAAVVTQSVDPASFDARARLENAISIARRESYRTVDIDWPALTVKVHASGDSAKDIVDLLPAYVTLTQELGDNHSFVRPTQAISDGWKARYGGPLIVQGGPPPLPAATSPFRGRTAIEWIDYTSTTGNRFRVITVPRMFGGGPPADAYASRLADAVLADAESVCGYVLDLRGNVGGNIWPMASGLSPLLGDVPFGLVKDADGVITHTIDLVQGAASVPSGPLQGTVFAKASGWTAWFDLTEKPVALLLDDGVASSGEGLAIAFKDRPSTRSFGQRTRGLATRNKEFDLGDGVTLGIASAWMVDRAGNHFPDGVPVDVPVDPATSGDTARHAAEQWLDTISGCST